MHIFAGNDPANRYNESMLSALPDRLISIQAKDQIPKNCNVSDVLKVKKSKAVWNRGISSVIKSQSQCKSYDHNKYWFIGQAS